MPEEKPLMEKLGRPFLLSAVLGLIYQIPIFMQAIFPWFPDIYGWRTLCASGQWYVTSVSPFAGIAGLSAFQRLAPLSILVYGKY